MRRFSKFWGLALGFSLLLATAAAYAADSLTWRAQQDKVDADIQSWDLMTVLKKIARQSGWKVYVEKGASGTVSVKFKNLSQDEALRRLLGSLNFSTDQTNGATRLLVFRTMAKAATQAVPAEKKNYRIANEDLVKLKRGATNSMDDLAKKLGAKILKRDDRIGLYRLQFSDAASADAALQELAADPSVAAADGNYTVDRPTPAAMAQVANAPGSPFALNPQPSADGPVIGLIDTAVDPPSQYAAYMLDPINITGEQDDPGDSPTHGTSMLETMVDAMPNDPSKILPVDIYGNEPSATSWELGDGIATGINDGANPISISSGGTGDSTIVGSIIAEGQKDGIYFIAATGNTPGAGDVYPAMYPGVISVTASTQLEGGPITVTGGGNQLASYANDPTGTDIMAPGSSLVQWNGQTWIVEGTSPATASVSGTIADLMNSQHISLSQAVSQVMSASPAPATPAH